MTLIEKPNLDYNSRKNFIQNIEDESSMLKCGNYIIFFIPNYSAKQYAIIVNEERTKFNSLNQKQMVQQVFALSKYQIENWWILMMSIHRTKYPIKCVSCKRIQCISPHKLQIQLNLSRNIPKKYVNLRSIQFNSIS